jgi:hypothetical protein
VNGIWSFAVNWQPAGVPGVADVVCLDVPGTYTVTSLTSASIAALVVGGGSAIPTLRFVGSGHPTWSIPTAVDIRSGAMVIDSALTITTDYFSVTGSAAELIMRSDSIVFEADSVANGGIFDSQIGTHTVRVCVPSVGPCQTTATMRNTGTIMGDGELRVALGAGAEFRMEEGTILHLTRGFAIDRANVAQPAPAFVWFGGTVDDAPGPVLAQGVNIRLPGTGMSGRLFSFGPQYVTGDIPSGVDVTIWDFLLTAGPVTPRSITGGPLVNRGYLGLSGVAVVGPGIVNRGAVGLSESSIDVDSLVNEGTGAIDVTGPTTLTTQLTNRGSVTGSGAGILDVVGTFIAEGGSTQQGLLLVHRGIVTGFGTLGDLQVFGGRIDPAGAGVGTLTLSSLWLDSGSTLTLDLAGMLPGQADRLTILGTAHYDGTLQLRELSPFAGGVCGQVLTLITDQSGSAPRGTFSRFTGLLPGPGRAWRAHTPPTLYQLVGYDPGSAVSRAPASLIVTEGGASQGYHVCLRSAPLASVTVTPGGGAGQLVLPPPMTFSLLTWALPRLTTLSAANDVVDETSPIATTLTHSVTSTDPAYGGARVTPLAVSVIDNDGSTNLELNIVSAPPTVTAGQSFTLTLREENVGPDASVGATVTIPASSGFSYLSATGVTSCAFDAVTGTTCQLAPLAAGGIMTLTVTFSALVAGSYPTTISLSTIQTDPNLANNVRTQTITIN